MKSVFAILIPSLLSLGHVAGDEEYTIKLERDGAVGEKRHLSAMVSNKVAMEMRVDGELAPTPPGSTENNRYKLEGDFEIVAKNAAGNISELKGKVANLISFKPDGTEESLVAEGTDVTLRLAEGAEEPTVTVEGKPAGAELAEIIGEFFDLGSEDEFDADAVFGTSEKKKVGESWAIDPVVAAKSFAESGDGLEIDPENLEGKLTLHGIVEREGIRCLDIRGELTMKGLKAPMPPGIEVSESLGRATFSGLFPIDESLSPIEENMSLDFTMNAAGKIGDNTLEMDIAAAMAKKGASIPYK